MTRPLLSVSISLFSLSLFNTAGLLPILAQTADIPASTTPVASDKTGSDTPSVSHSHGDSSALALLGLVAGGAALMGGGHGSGGSLSSSSVGPQAIYTPAAVPTPAAPVSVISLPTPAVVSKPAAVVTPSITAVSTTSSPVYAFAPASPTIIVTAPVSLTTTGVGPISVVPASVISPLSPTTEAPTNVNQDPVVPVAVVPEPGTMASMGLGSFLIAGLLLRTRRKAGASVTL